MPLGSVAAGFALPAAAACVESIIKQFAMAKVSISLAPPLLLVECIDDDMEIFFREREIFYRERESRLFLDKQ